MVPRNLRKCTKGQTIGGLARKTCAKKKEFKIKQKTCTN